MKAVPGGARYTPAPQSGGWGSMNPVAANATYGNASYAGGYGPFLPRPSRIFTDGAFGPATPIQPIPVDEPAVPGGFPDPRYWQPPISWNLPTQPRTEGLSLCSFQTLYTLASKYCLSPMTRVLCSDFTWRPLAEVHVGDELIAFDETPPAPKQHRKMRTATVTECERIIRPSYRVRFTDGREVIASAEHLWLSGKRGGNIREWTARACEVCGRYFEKPHAFGAHRQSAHGIDGWYKHRNDQAAWIATEQLRPGSIIKDLGKPWERDTSWESGYLSGVFDGEASLSAKSGSRVGWQISFPQLPGAVFDLTESLLKAKGYRTNRWTAGKDGCEHISISGLDECCRFLGETRPVRLLGNALKWLDGGSPARLGCATVESVEFLGDQEVVAIGTSTKTLIAEGLFSHNSVARQCIQLRKDEILGLEWHIDLTTKAAKAYQNDHHAMRDFGERAALATKFFRHPDPDYWNFGSFLSALLEEIFTYDALSLIFRPKYGRGLGRGLLGSDLDSLRLVSGTTIRPVFGMHGERPRPPAVAFQQYLFGVPRSDYQTILSGADIDDYGLTGSQVNEFRADVMLYAPLVPRRESPYGLPPVERALLPIISGLQKQEYQLSYFTEGTVPSVYISPGDPNMTPTQIRELQDALNGIAGDAAYHLKVICLPPGSKVEPQRPVDLSDTFDTLVQTQVCMAFDVMPDELGILPNVGSAGSGGSSNASALRFASGESRDPKGRKSTKPLLMFLCDIANYVLQDICGQQDMQFSFEGLVAEDDKQALVERGIQGIQNGLYSIDEVRGWLDLPPWGLPETSEPVVFTAQGPIPFSMAPEIIRAAVTGNTPPPSGSQGTNSGQRSPSSRSRTTQPAVRRGGQTRPNGTHPKPVGPHRESLTPAHSAAAGAIQSPTPRTGGTPSRSQVAGSRKRGESATGRATRHKAVASELDALRRHLRKGRMISTWEPEHLPERALSSIAEDIARGVLIDTAVERAGDLCLKISGDEGELPDFCRTEAPAWEGCPGPWPMEDAPEVTKAAHWPGWERDLGLVGAYKVLIGQAFHDAETRGSALRKKAATGAMFVSNATLRDLISDEVRDVFSAVLTPLWTEAWHLGYAAAKSLVTGQPADFAAKQDSEALAGFIGTEGEHWLSGIARTGLGNNSARSELIARTEAGRAIASAAIQCYRDHGVQYKHLLLSPGACDICKDTAEDGDIPLDAPFSSGGVTGQSHPADRCVPGPSWVDAEPPLADLGKASGYSLNSRSGMISLDLPPGTISPVPGGVDDHHITVVYLGPDVDDDAFAVACQRAASAAALVPGPLAGALSGIGTFPPSGSSDGKVPIWAGVMLPGAEVLRDALEDLSASEHTDWKPHVTLAYVEPGEALPDPLPATPVTFTHLSVHRGHGEVVRFPLGPAGKSAPAEDKSRVAWLLIRARAEDGKWRYLLQQRDDGSWGMPGGSTHVGEAGPAAAVREATEEIGTLPSLSVRAVLDHVDPDGVKVYLYLCEAGSVFTPQMDGSTPQETRGVAWFRRKEVGDLDLAPKFRDDWDHIIADCLDGLKHDAVKAMAPLQRMVNENGEVLELTEASQRLQAVGSRWPYPHRADGAEWPDAGPGAVPDEHGSAGGEPPHWVDDHAEPDPHADIAPRGSDDGKMPDRGRKPNPPAEAFPNQGSEHDDMWPMPQATLTPGVLSVGANTGVPPSGASKNDSGHPVAGSVPAVTPQAYKPHATRPEAYDPGGAVERWDPEQETDIAPDTAKGAGGPGDYSDANPVDPEHILSIMRENFPESALGWVKRAAWTGPQMVPWERIDHDDEAKWAAAHQPAKVRQFVRDIKAGRHANPSILFQPPGDGKVVVADGHHRAVARHSMGQDVLAYVGHIRPGDREAAEQTHSSQLHQGDDPANKAADPAEVLHEYWTREGHGGPTDFAYADEIKWGTPGDFMRAVALLKEHAHMTDEQARGYANLLHHRALGYWPAQHAQMERGE
jgi:8-oxo-dGTP pyrophosphatase MutT (NUDIX family)/2'-5' RNA ligase